MYNLNFVLETRCVDNWNKKNLNQILIVSVNNHFEYFCITREMNTNNCQDRNIILSFLFPRKETMAIFVVLHHAEKTPWLTHVALFYQVGLMT